MVGFAEIRTFYWNFLLKHSETGCETFTGVSVYLYQFGSYQIHSINTYILFSFSYILKNRVSQAILYHLAELRGMSLWYEKFGVLGLTTQTLHTAIMTVGSFVLKSSELQQWVQQPCSQCLSAVSGVSAHWLNRRQLLAFKSVEFIFQSYWWQYKEFQSILPVVVCR